MWRYGGEDIEDWAWNFCNKIWRGEGWLESWKEGIIIPIAKKGEGKGVEDYRGITLMPTLYKVYAMIMAGRLEEEVERKGIIPQNQTGFRRGMGAMDNIYVINYLINRQLGRKEGKLVAMFADLRMAFDSVDKELLVRVMKERGIRRGLIERVEEVIRETKSRVRVGRELGESFWTTRGVRQGCSVSYCLIFFWQM